MLNTFFFFFFSSNALFVHFKRQSQHLASGSNFLAFFFCSSQECLCVIMGISRHVLRCKNSHCVCVVNVKTGISLNGYPNWVAAGECFFFAQVKIMSSSRIMCVCVNLWISFDDIIYFHPQRLFKEFFSNCPAVYLNNIYSATDNIRLIGCECVIQWGCDLVNMCGIWYKWLFN